MAANGALEKIDVHLVRVLHTVLTTSSVSRTALRLGMHQPGVSASLQRLRTLTGDPLLVRAGNRMVPTEIGLGLIEPAARMLEAAEQLLASAATRQFDPATSTATLRIAASDYLDPMFLPVLVAELKRRAPSARLEIAALSEEYDYRSRLAAGEVDLVIGNWLTPPADLHQGQLISDEVVCLVAAGHPSVKRGWGLERYLACEHVAPSPLHAGAVGVVDEHLARQGLDRRIGVRCPHFVLIPPMVAQSLLVLTTGRLFCSRFIEHLPVRIVSCPVPFPPLKYYQLWHERTHASPHGRWLRDTVRAVAGRLRSLREIERLR